MKTLLLFAAICLLTTPAFAVIDPAPNSIGLYFDEAGEVIEQDVAEGAGTFVFVVVTNPTHSLIGGYEFGYSLSSDAAVHITTTLRGTGPLDISFTPQCHIVGLGEPMLTSEATVLAMMNFLVLDDSEPVYLTIHEATPSSDPDDEFPVLAAGDDPDPYTFELVILGTSSYFDGQHQANCVINGSGVVATQAVSLDEIKSLYR